MATTSIARARRMEVANIGPGGSMATITWTKGKSGDWLVRGPLGLHGTVSVSKRDGSTSEATIAREIWSKDDVALYAVAPRGKVYVADAFNGYGRPRGGYRR